MYRQVKSNVNPIKFIIKCSEVHIKRKSANKSENIRIK